MSGRVDHPLGWLRHVSNVTVTTAFDRR
jgi:hypothetical protein